MKRKINRVGQNTLTVSLPVKWAKEHDVKKGDEIDVLEDKGTLILSVKASNLSKSIKIKMLHGNSWYTDQVIRNLYTAGYDHITIEFDEPKVAIKLQEAVDKLIGFEIVEQGKAYCVIRSVSAPLSESFEILMRRVFLQTSQMFDKIMDDLSEGVNSDIDTVRVMRNSIYKLITFCRRTLHKTTPYSEQKNSSLSFILQRMSSIAGSMLYMYEYLSKKKRYAVRKETLDFFKKTKEQFTLFYETIYTEKIGNVERINKNREILLNETMPSLLEKHAGVDAVMICYMSDMVRTLSTTAAGILKYLFEE